MIDCMPVATREAMLAGVRANERVIAGAYVDDRGGVCPMLAAHRRGQRKGFIAFVRSWDRFTRVGGASREATPRELRILVRQLEDSLAMDDELELSEAIREHKALRSQTLREQLRPRRETADGPRSPGSKLHDAADPSGEIRARRLLGRFARGHRRRPRGALAYNVSPGRMNMISGTTHAGEVFSR
ncbi:MAG TPA: hypothetical protein VGX69_06000 [Solirubrobacteraceae bacterium]|nr:hypothetical protein [Solirubrobacteraceae bacterium]